MAVVLPHYHQPTELAAALVVTTTAHIAPSCWPQAHGATLNTHEMHHHRMQHHLRDSCASRSSSRMAAGRPVSA